VGYFFVYVHQSSTNVPDLLRELVGAQDCRPKTFAFQGKRQDVGVPGVARADVAVWEQTVVT
jgi:hypothetical protein